MTTTTTTRGTSRTGISAFEILERLLIAGSEEISPCGSYEYIRARASGCLDPDAECNGKIVNLEHAERDRDGLVSYETDVHIVCPVSVREHLTVVLNIVNRGGWIGPLPDFRRGISEIDPREDAIANGVGFMMTQGLAVVWSGWQADLPDDPDLIRARLPVARGVTGMVREEIIPDTPVGGTVFDTAERSLVVPLLYPVEDVAAMTLSVRARTPEARTRLPGSRIEMLEPTQLRLALSPDFDAGAIYEIAYPSRDPIIGGAGFAVTRDLAVYLGGRCDLASGGQDPFQAAGHQVGKMIAKGYSQGARFLREFLRDGYNTSADGKPVFDGMYLIAGGARHTKANKPFWRVSRFSRQHEDSDAPDFSFPFSYASSTDAFSGQNCGLLSASDSTAPLVVDLETDSEFWHGRASLLVTDTLGRDLAQPHNVRLYFVAGQHVMGRPEDLGIENICAAPVNDIDWGPLSRALLKALLDWVANGTEPPKSIFPTRQAGTLVTAQEAAARLPRQSVLFGCDSIAQGWVYSQPDPVQAPAPRHQYPVFVPCPDEHGNPSGGVTVPELVAPRAVYSGRNLRRAGHARGELSAIWGSAEPFDAFDDEEGQERAGELRKACLEHLVQKRLLLPIDVIDG